ncbi:MULTISPECIES: hypothetical protein [Erwinia]|uniref:DUF1918 domain-containing protein n=2 Tax=Erwinia TaxID=551 RepID=A0A014NL02_9GAMM|nr:hypothetical protein [Erwinia mallotivora]EXU74470.1 hypothetical protein BG55_16520 [Erwinia mallotivora]
MTRYSEGSIVKHKTGDIKGMVTNVFAQDHAPTGYYVRWDDGNHSYHGEKELRWANIDRPRMHYTQQSPK